MGYGGIFGGIDTMIWGKNADKVYGRKLITPPLATLQEAQKTALAANQANFADIAKTATAVNTLNQDQLNSLIDKVLGPGVREQFQKNLASEARGELPQDVQNAIYRGTAERAAGGNAFGGGASGFTRNINARDIGLTSYQITNNALSSAESWLQQAKAPTFDAMGMFGISTAQQNAANLDQFNRNLMEAKVAAAPDPAARGQFDTWMGLLGSVLSVYSGGPGYQNTYHPGTEASAMPSYASNYGGGMGGGSGGGGYYLPQSTFYGGPSQGALIDAPQGYGTSDAYGNLATSSARKGGGLGGLAAMFA